MGDGRTDHRGDRKKGWKDRPLKDNTAKQKKKKNGIHTQEKGTEKQTERANFVTDGCVTGANRMVWADTEMAGGLL